MPKVFFGTRCSPRARKPVVMAGLEAGWGAWCSRIGFSLPLLWLLTLPLLISGCATQKQTWQEWLVATNAMGFQPLSLGVPEPSPYATNLPYRPGYEWGVAATAGPGFDLAVRNPSFPATYIAAVHIDLTAPSNSVHLAWAGPDAAAGPAGPWRSSVGRGQPSYDCNEVEDSNTMDSWCTPKGVFPVAGFDDHLNAVPACRYVTWVIHEPRFIAIHSHRDIPNQAVSHGCIRVPLGVAKLIHNNSLAGVTRVHIYGEWTRPLGLRDGAATNPRFARGPRAY